MNKYLVYFESHLTVSISGGAKRRPLHVVVSVLVQIRLPIDVLVVIPTQVRSEWVQVFKPTRRCVGDYRPGQFVSSA